MPSTSKIADLTVFSGPYEQKTLVNAILVNKDLSDLLFSYCTEKTFLSISRTCRIGHEAVKSYMRQAYNINRILTPFITSPLAFRQLQARTGALISGSAALQFFDRSYYPEADLDIYVSHKFRLDVANFFLGDGYTFKPTQKQNANLQIAAVGRTPDPDDEYELKAVRVVLTFVKDRKHGEPLKTQVVVTEDNPMESVLGFHSSMLPYELPVITSFHQSSVSACVMNVISCDTAYSLYPLATFEERKALICRPPYDDRTYAAHNKYYDRGWEVREDHDYAEERFILYAQRWIGDKHTWKIPLDTTHITDHIPLRRGSEPLTRDPIVATNWMLDHNCVRGGLMIADVMTNPFLACTYVIDPSDTYFFLQGIAVSFLGEGPVRLEYVPAILFMHLT